MLDIALLFFENLSPELISAPFMFLKADKAPYYYDDEERDYFDYGRREREERYLHEFADSARRTREYLQNNPASERNTVSFGHMTDLSHFLSTMLGQDPSAPAAEYAPNMVKRTAPRQKDKKVALYGDLNKFVENFKETAPQEFGHDVFRIHEEVPQFILDKYSATNKKSALEEAWVETREHLGFHGDCRFDWEIIDSMSLAQIILMQANPETAVSLPEDGNVLRAIHKSFQYPISEDILDQHAKRLKDARVRLQSITFEGIRGQAALLSHHDLSEIRDWGKKIDFARVEAIRDLKDNTVKTALHTDGKLGEINAELSTLLRAKTPKGLAGHFYKVGMVLGWNKAVKPTFKTVNSRQKAGEYELERVGEVYDYRAMNHEDRKTAEKKLTESLEDEMRGTIDSEDERIAYAESAQDVVYVFQNLLRQHRSALAKNRNRIVGDAKNQMVHATNGASDQIVARDISQKIIDEIDERLEALDESIEICERERLHYESLAALHKNHKRILRSSINHSLERLRDFERKEQQVLLTQNIALAGQYAQNLDGMALEKQLEIVTQRLRDARAEEVEKLSETKKAMDTDEILVLDYQKPIALLEDQRSVAMIEDQRETVPQVG